MKVTAITLLLLLCVAALRYPGFFSATVFTDLLRDNAFLGIAAIGMTFVILSGGIDLSVGAVIGFVSIFSSRLMRDADLPGPIIVLLSISIGVAFGVCQGWLISRCSLPPFLVTLAGMFVARGLAFAVSMEAITITDPLYRFAAQSRLTLPLMFLATFAAAAFALGRRSFGRNVYALGGNADSALLMGVPVARVRIAVYAVSGFCAALAGIAHGVYTSSGNATAGTLFELDAIAAVVIGGATLTGGVGTVSGSVLGVLVLGVIQTAITFEGTLSSWWTKITTGVLLLFFILLQRVFKRTATDPHSME